MKIGLSIPVRNNADGASIQDFAVAAEELGFASLWQGDHVVIPDTMNSPYPYAYRFAPNIDDLFPDPGFLECCTSLSFLAGCTKRVLLGSGVLVLPMRNPVFLAKQLASVSVLSGGRLIAGVGSGWLKEEFDVLGAPFEKRGARTDEWVTIMRKLWAATEPVGHSGRFYSFEPVRFKPTPPGGSIPIWVGGQTEVAFRRVVRYASGWYPVEMTPAEVERGYQRICELAREAGRTDRITLALSTRLTLTGGSINDTIKLVREYERIGVDHLVVYATTKRSAKENLERMERIAREILPVVAGAAVSTASP